MDADTKLSSPDISLKKKETDTVKSIAIDKTKSRGEMTLSSATPPKSSYRQNHVSTVMLGDVAIVALLIDAKERLCLAQISNTLLKGYSYNEIHNRRVALGITCVQCTPVQLEILRRAGAMPVSSRRCGMITKRESERLVKSFLEDTRPPKLPEDFAFDVEHDCGWGCRGNFMPSRYNSSRAKCIKCAYCNMFFSPNKFIFHFHRMPEGKYNHPDAANFNSWRRHLKLTSEMDKNDLVYAWEDVKAMFNGGSRKRMSSGTRSDSHIQKTQDSIKKPRFHAGGTLDSKPNRTHSVEYTGYPIFQPTNTGAPYPLLPAAFPPLSLGLPHPTLHHDRSPFVAPHRTIPVSLPSDYSNSPRTRPLFCNPFDKIWPKYPSLFFQGSQDLGFSNRERLDSSDQRLIGFKSTKSFSSNIRRDDSPVMEDASKKVSRDHHGISAINGRTEGSEWCSAFRLVGQAGKQNPLQNISSENMKSKHSIYNDDFTSSERNRPNSAEDEDDDKTSEKSDAEIDAAEDSDGEISVKDPDVSVDVGDEDESYVAHIESTPELQETPTEDHDSSPVASPMSDKNKDTDTNSNVSHRKETADSTSGSADFSTFSREQLQSELQLEMEARKKVEKECTSIKETFEDQIKQAMQYREEIAKQLQVVRETLCTKLDQERKVRMSLQEKLKEAHDALHSFTCNMLASHHCTECSVKEIMP